MSEENRVEDFVVKIEFFEKSLCELCVQIIVLEDYKIVLELEILRLVEVFGKDDLNLDVEFYIEQLSIYEVDFEKERKDKEKVEIRVFVFID